MTLVERVQDLYLDELNIILQPVREKGSLEELAEEWGVLKEWSFQRRPPIFQFEPETVRVACYPLVAESPAPFLTQVESFILLNKTDLLRDALESQDNPLDPRNFNERLRWLLAALKTATGLDFLGASASRIGNIEVYSFPLETVNDSPPVKVFVDKQGTTSDEKKTIEKEDGRCIFIQRKPKLDSQNVIAHIVLRNGGDVIYDQIHHLPAGEGLSGPFEAQEPISEYEVRLFTNSGKTLVFYERIGLIRDISISLNLGGQGRRVVHDQFSHRLGSQGSLKSQANQVTSANTFSAERPFTVGGHKTDPWVRAQYAITRFVRPLLVQPEKGHWFPGGLKSEADVFLYLRNLAESTDNEKVILADPYFDAIAFGRWMLRLRNQSPQYQILTSFDQKRISGLELLKRLCLENQALLPPNLTILNIVCETGQAFHDRYLTTVKSDGNVSVYLLSGSLNKAAGDTPFCIVELETGLARTVYNHLNDLAQGQETDRPNVRELTCTPIWKPKDPKEALHLSASSYESELRKGFPFWKIAVGWLLGTNETSSEVLREMGRQKGFFDEDRGWHFDPKIIKEQIHASPSVISSSIEDRAKSLCAIGELLARTPKENDFLADHAKFLQRFAQDGNSVTEILSKMTDLYLADELSINRLQSIKTERDLTVQTIYDELNFSTQYQLYEQAESYLRYSFDFHSQLYGLQYAFIAFSKINPHGTVAWLDSAIHAKIRTTAVSIVVTALSEYQIPELVPALLLSKLPFYRMLGAAYLNSEETGAPRRQFKEVTRILKDADFSEDDIVWIMTCRLQDAQVRWYKAQDKDVSQRKAADAEKKEVVEQISAIWPVRTLSSSAETNFEGAIRGSTWDRYQLAEALDASSAPQLHQGSKPLYERCIADIEQLVGRNSDNYREQIMFYGAEAYLALESGAKAFIKLRKSFRNRELNHVIHLVQIASQPFAYRKDFDLWNGCVGRAALGLLFGFYVVQEGFQRGELEGLDKLSIGLLENTRLLFLGEKGKWFDINGVLNRLIQVGSATTVMVADETVTEELFERIASDQRLPSYLRGSAAVFHPSVFRNDPNRAVLLTRAQREETGKHQVTRYFHLLDYLIGRAAMTATLPEDQIINEINAGLAAFPKIREEWKDFFLSVWNAIKGDIKAKQKILANEEQSRSFCGTILIDTENKNV